MNSPEAMQVGPASFLGGRADSIYFLMFGSWAQELRSNRWHYASRWAQHVPVVLVQPILTSDGPSSWSEPEPRVPNCRILYVRNISTSPNLIANRMTQAQEILADMVAHNHIRPILWAYAPDYVFAYAILPAAMRFFHATENYFYFEGLRDEFFKRLKSMLKISDAVVGVSEGVVASYRPFAGGRTEVVTNGCDYKDYARGGADVELAAAGRGWSKVAVYAGNINNRIDFGLMHQCARVCPGMLLAVFGPVAGLSATEMEQWEAFLKEPNVRHFGPVGIERLPAIFGTADVGLVPYRQIPILVDNTFPLKVFEMQATGLPVVSTYMRAIDTHAGPGLSIAKTTEEFIAGVQEISRRGLSDSDRTAIAAASAAQDYDRKFDRVCALVNEILADNPEPRAPGAELFGFHGPSSEWLSLLNGALAELVVPRERIWAAARADVAASLTPIRDGLARFIPEGWRRRLGRWRVYRSLFR